MYNIAMSFKALKKEWPIAIYALLLGWIFSAKLLQMIDPQSPKYFYYFFLYHFDNRFYLPYLANWAQIILNLFHILPVIFYAMRIHILPKRFWQAMLILRLIFDITGHNYEMNLYISYFHMKTSIGLLGAATTLGLFLPSYIICFQYAFGNLNSMKNPK